LRRSNGGYKILDAGLGALLAISILKITFTG